MSSSEDIDKFIAKRKDPLLSLLRKENTSLQSQLVKANEALIGFGQQLVIANGNAERARQDAERARQDAVVLSHRLADIAQDVIAKPQSSELLHAILMHEIKPKEGETTRSIAFTRCQRRSIGVALKRLEKKNPDARLLYRNGYVPNGVNILNCLKEEMKKTKTSYKSRNNVIEIMEGKDPEEIVRMVQIIVREDRVFENTPRP